jgi:hypothetical protein
MPIDVAASNVVSHLFIIIVFPIGIPFFFDTIDIVGANSLPRLLLRGSPHQHHSDFATVDCVELEMPMSTVDYHINFLQKLLHVHIASANNTQLNHHHILLGCEMHPIVLHLPLPDSLHDFIMCNHMRFVGVIRTFQHIHHPFTLKKVIGNRTPPDQYQPIHAQIHLVRMLLEHTYYMNINS